MTVFKAIAPLAAIASLAFATAAHADTIPLTPANVGNSYTLNYNGFSGNGGATIAGLTASTTFTLASISTNAYVFNYSITNTSTAPVSSRVSSFGFNTNPDADGASSTGTFNFATLDSSYPNGIGDIDVCFKGYDTGSCAGGGGGGIDNGQTGTGTFTLSFLQPITALTLSDFYVRYQSVEGVRGVTSASGAGSLTNTSGGSSGNQVPEPGMVGLIGGALLATAFLRRRRKVAADAAFA